jgi:hypothetical protein
MLEAGLRFTAMGSATAIGCETNSSGGNFTGKKRSRRFPNRPVSRLSFGSSRPTGIREVVRCNSDRAGKVSGSFRPCEGSREGLRSGFVKAGLPITVRWEAEPQHLLQECETSSVPIESVSHNTLDSSERIADHQIPLSLPVIFCPTAAAVASHGSKPRRALLYNSPFRSKPVSCVPYRLADCGIIGTRRKSLR